MKGGFVHLWLVLFLMTRFFTTCSIHISSAHNECNIFCIDFQEAPLASFCYFYRSCDHSSYHVIQVRRSSYHDVVRVAEFEEILDKSGVQTYVRNSTTVVFQNDRHQLRSSDVFVVKASSSSHSWETCSRALLDAFHFCSLGCNLKGINNDMEIKVVYGNCLVDIEKNGGTDYSNDSANTESCIESCSDVDYCKEIPPPTWVIHHHRQKGIPRCAPLF